MDPQDTDIIRQIDSLSQALASQNRPDLYGASSPWTPMGEKHKRYIRDSGFNSFKRTLNFEYHQWGVESFLDSKIRRLVAALLKLGKLPYGPLLVKWHESSTTAAPPPINRRAYLVFMGLLWQYALTVDKLRCLQGRQEPEVGQPLPVTRNGRLISQDLATSAIELNHIANHVDLSRVVRIAELGAGYGRSAFLFTHCFPSVKYHIFDIPPAVVISQTYLQAVLGKQSVLPYDPVVHATPSTGSPEPRIHIYLPHQIEMFPDNHFDLLLAISSMDEMNRDQVRYYFELIDHKCRGWFYIKGHERGSFWGFESIRGLSELPYPANWTLVASRKDPFSPTFVERIYRIGKPEGTARSQG